MAIEATPEKLQASKEMPTPSLSQMIEQLTRENGYLRQELAYQYKMRDASMYLLEETKFVFERLRMAVITFRKVQKEIEEGHEDEVVTRLRNHLESNQSKRKPTKP